MIAGRPANLLGRHVAQRPDQSRVGGARPRRRVVSPRAGHLHRLASPKSRIFTCPSLGVEQVLGLQVPVDDPLLVRGRQAPGDLQRVVDRLSARSGPASSTPRSVSPSRSSMTAKAVSRASRSRRWQGCSDETAPPPLGPRAGTALARRHPRPALRQDLDRNVASQLRVARAIDLPHPPAPSGAMMSYDPSRVPAESVIE